MGSACWDPNLGSLAQSPAASSTLWFTVGPGGEKVLFGYIFGVTESIKTFLFQQTVLKIFLK